VRKLFTPAIRYFGISLLFTLAGNLCIVFIPENINAFIEAALLKKVFDMYALLFLKFALYDFMHKSVAGFWMRYSFLLLLIAVVMSQYPLLADLAPLLVSVYQGIITVVICYAVAAKREGAYAERGAALIILLLAGASKTLFPHYAGVFYIYELLLWPLFSFYIMFIFLVRIHQNLAEKENKFELLAENATDIIFDYRLKPVPYFTFISPAAEILTGYRLKEFYDNPNLFEELTVNADRKPLRELFEGPGLGALTVKWQKKSGDYIWVEFHTTPIYNEGEMYSIEGIIRNITERKLAEEELIQSRKAKQILFSHISHELKTPITSILGYAKALDSNVIEDPEERNGAINLIVSKALMLQRLTDDMIQLSKLESHQFSFNFTEVSVIRFFEIMTLKQKTAADAAGIRFHSAISRKLAEKGPKIIADIERMDQVFDNLVNNAVKFTQKDGEIWISCDLDSSKKNIVFEVRDTGCGIPEENLPFIFETYFKAERVKGEGVQGSGLGLSIVKEIVKGHQGDIFVESKEGKGSNFIIIVPLYAQEE